MGNLGKRLSVLFLLFGFWSAPVRAQSPATAPDELKEVLREIEAAANRQDVAGVMEYYSPEFENTDGLVYPTVEAALTKLWERYPRLGYTIELQSWERAGRELVAETVTQISGSEEIEGRLMKLDSNIRSRQYFQGDKLVRQEILTERTEVTAGDNPPEVDVNLPEEVRVGQEYNFEVIVQEPLGNNVLLGGAKEEQVNGDRYLTPGTFDLEVLPGGGIFKLVSAPYFPDYHWLSAILLQGDGMRITTHRVRIKN
ncbi:MAG: nuclear transport factor 2 family protein [Gomphosphaeria aponina SAG 52.96 = DSM 107014]|uniref:Nuclear transport factor 2 family protein n=1 Tax=Gomphosphaeria aponina SAG 52.96 = DSM 107014 TaxID=1521640 RepID=A0A941GPU2_9CHRO|nr:nuclear transport factor 2 family protein [Gomphosphaeria aponina SAG 52.96 = DSM 107014]